MKFYGFLQSLAKMKKKLRHFYWSILKPPLGKSTEAFGSHFFGQKSSLPPEEITDLTKNIFWILIWLLVSPVWLIQ